jgi:hypothetical protein
MMMMMREVSDVIHERDRMAQRADKWWRSAWHVQMLMCGRGIGFDVGREILKPLTDDVGRGFLKAQSKHKLNVGRSDNTMGETK